ncbi:hypothetical protein [Paenibacillus sp. NEAU-GSW1]|uniref:hypothetical protein n=1 Tax=Paenibacillus sp. NEAU-GSW1 TaxID=2682486 RepID=UPI001563F3AB|nr:hypothetical protein [Paenibacillus sp. NEAU-GSW1]
MNNTEVIATKDFSTVIVEENELVDYKYFLSPEGELNNLDLDMRINIADYMKENNYKLAEGKHEFYCKIF